MRISDWSSDVCSSDLTPAERRGSAGPMMTSFPSPFHAALDLRRGPGLIPVSISVVIQLQRCITTLNGDVNRLLDWKRVVEGKGCSVRVDLGGSGIIQKKKQ